MARENHFSSPILSWTTKRREEFANSLLSPPRYWTESSKSRIGYRGRINSSRLQRNCSARGKCRNAQRSQARGRLGLGLGPQPKIKRSKKQRSALSGSITKTPVGSFAQ